MLVTEELGLELVPDCFLKLGSFPCERLHFLCTLRGH